MSQAPSTKSAAQYTEKFNIALQWMWGDGGAAYIFRCREHREELAMLWQNH